MKLITDVAEMRSFSALSKGKGLRLILVPTMGALHAGHAALVREGREAGGKDAPLVVSIFVNPAQFGPGEDYLSYPRDLDKDVEAAVNAGADVVFAPLVDQMYPEGFKTHVTVEGLSERLCGASRPGHFKGVATVVSKLFNMVNPDIAVFGKKDYQQFVIIKRMCLDLNLGVEIIGADIVRSADGLALSSRNAQLNPLEREAALRIPRSLSCAVALVKKGERSAKAIIDMVRDIMATPVGGVALTIEYASLVSPETLEDVETIHGPGLLAVAVRVGKTRLIDNVFLNAC